MIAETKAKELIRLWQNAYRDELKQDVPDRLVYIRGIIDGLRLALGLPFAYNALEPVGDDAKGEDHA